MARNCLVKVDDAVYVNFYEVAMVHESKVGRKVHTNIVLKCGASHIIEDMTPQQVCRRIGLGIDSVDD